MSSQPYTVEIEEPAGVVVARARSFWEVDTMRGFTSAIMAEVNALLRQRRTPLLLVDAREHGVQSQEIVSGLQQWAQSDAVRSIRTAVLVDSALYRMQAKRIGHSEAHSIFNDEAEARSWLTGA